MEADEDLTVVVSRILARLDHEEAMLAAVLRFGKVAAREGMRVEPTKPRRIRLESVSSFVSRGDHRRAFFHCAIYRRGKKQAVPVNNLRISGEVVNLNCLFYTLAHAKKWTGDLAVVRDCAEVALWGGFESIRSDLERDVRCSNRSGSCWTQESGPCSHAGKLREASAGQDCSFVSVDHNISIFERAKRGRGKDDGSFMEIGKETI